MFQTFMFVIKTRKVCNNIFIIFWCTHIYSTLLSWDIVYLFPFMCGNSHTSMRFVIISLFVGNKWMGKKESNNWLCAVFLWIVSINCTWLKIVLKFIIFYVTTNLQKFFQFNMLVLLPNVVSLSLWERMCSGMPCRPHANLTVDAIIVCWVWNQITETIDSDKT